VPRLPHQEGHPITLTFFIHGRVCKAGRVTLGLGLPYDLMSVTIEFCSSDCPGVIFRSSLKDDEYGLAFSKFSV